MPTSIGDINVYKVSLGDLYNISKISIGETVVYSSGNTVTYHVDTDVVCQEEVEEGESCLFPKSFTPTKNGWEFYGWAQDAHSGTVYDNLTMGEEPIELYAVFKQKVTVAYYNGSTTASQAIGYNEYNNGNGASAVFALQQAALSGWTARGWSAGTAGDGAIYVGNGLSFSQGTDITLYGMYQQTIVVTYYNASASASTTSGIRYYNSNGNVVNPSFTLTQATWSGWTARGWSTSNAGNAGITYNNGAAFTRSSNVTLYGLYQQTITLSYSGNGNTGGATAAQTGTRYWAPAGYINPSFTLRANGFTKTGYSFSKWALGSASGTQYAAGTSITLAASNTMYAVWTMTSYYAYQNGVANAAMGISNPTIYKSDANDGRINSAVIQKNGNAVGPLAEVYCDKDKSGPKIGAVTPSIPTNGMPNVSISVTFEAIFDNGGIGTPYTKIYGINASGSSVLLSEYIGGVTNGVFNVSNYKYIQIYMDFYFGGGSSGLSKKYFLGIDTVRFY